MPECDCPPVTPFLHSAVSWLCKTVTHAGQARKMTAKSTAGQADQNTYSVRYASRSVSVWPERQCSAAALTAGCGTSCASPPYCGASAWWKSGQLLCVAPVGIAPVAYSSVPAPSAAP